MSAFDLDSVVDLIIKSPDLLKKPEYRGLQKLIEAFGGKIPECAPEKEAAAEESPHESSDEESKLSDISGINDGVIEGDVAEDQPMGDSTKEPTEAEIDEAQEYRSKAIAAYSEQKYQEAIDLYTQAIQLNPGTALFHAKRGQAYLKLQKPNACIRDCDKALEINCDSAAGYKFRGRAYRLLGKWEEAAKDLRQACKIDYDEEADEWLREVTPIAKKLEMRRLAKERKMSDKDYKRKMKQPPPKAKAPEPKASGDGGLFDSFKFDPEIQAMVDDISKNPNNIEKYLGKDPNPEKLLKFFKNFAPQFSNAAGGGAPGAGAGAPGASTASAPNPEAEVPPPDAEAPTAPPKKVPEYIDEVLD